MSSTGGRLISIGSRNRVDDHSARSAPISIAGSNAAGIVSLEFGSIAGLLDVLTFDLARFDQVTVRAEIDLHPRARAQLVMPAGVIPHAAAYAADAGLGGLGSSPGILGPASNAEIGNEGPLPASPALVAAPMKFSHDLLRVQL
jgi:hypothetical protein